MDDGTDNVGNTSDGTDPAWFPQMIAVIAANVDTKLAELDQLRAQIDFRLAEATSEESIDKLNELRTRLDVGGSPSNMLNVKQVAWRLGLVKPNGTPRETAYKLAEQLGTKIANKWYVAEDALEAHVRRAA